MKTSILSLFHVPQRDRTAKWLWRALQGAVELELATIPPYLCALWSLEDQSGSVYDSLRRIVVEEMTHFGLACNLKAAFGRPPKIATASAEPRYPGPLPGGVHPGLRVSLRPLSKDVIGNTFMQIEFPNPEAVTTYGVKQYPTIGAFYAEIARTIQSPSIPFVGGHQREYSEINLTVITSKPEALDAVEVIRAEGEGAHGSPFIAGKRLAHYYQFAELFWERQITRCKQGWGFCGKSIPFPKNIYPMAVVPRHGYPEVPKARAFDRNYSQLVRQLQVAWNVDQGGEQALEDAVTLMRDKSPGSMFALARELMQIRRPDGQGNYGPDFRLI